MTAHCICHASEGMPHAGNCPAVTAPAGGLWAFCPHCETLFLDCYGKEVIHSCAGKLTKPDPDSDDEFVRSAGRSPWRGFIRAVGMSVSLAPKLYRKVVRGR